MVNWAQIHNPSLVAIVYRAPTPTQLHCCTSGKSHKLGRQDSSYTVFLPTKARLYKRLFGMYFDQWAETSPIQSELHSYILICIFTDQSEWLHNDQLGHVIPTNQDIAIWTNQT